MQQYFQYIVLGLFAVFAVGGLLFFAGVGGFGGDEQQIGQVEIWGTFPKETMDQWISNVSSNNDGFTEVSYRQIDPRFYEQELVEAFASSRAPDLFFLSQADVLREQERIVPIPYANLSERTFKSAFIEEAELFLFPEGIYALPVIVDPLVLYWNRDILTNEGVAQPPRSWDELFALTQKITRRDGRGNILRATVAFGEYANIPHAKEILTGLILQAGNSIVGRTSEGRWQSLLNAGGTSLTTPVPSALRFYTEFSNPTKNVYTWNRALTEAKRSFSAGNLALYVGFASEFSEIARANPNLNFDVAVLPQIKGAGSGLPTDSEGTSAQPATSVRTTTYGELWGLAIPKTSNNIAGAAQAGFILVQDASLNELARRLLLPPVSRSALSIRPTQSALSVFYDSALISRGWLDPSPLQTEVIFKDMIEDVTSGKLGLTDSIRAAEVELNKLLPKP